MTLERVARRTLRCHTTLARGTASQMPFDGSEIGV